MNSFDTYFFLQFLLLLVSIYCGLKINKNNMKNVYVLIFILTFTLIEGLRFGRGIDYNVYYYSFQTKDVFDVCKSNTILFDLLCFLLIKLGLPYQALIICSSSILAIAGTKLLIQYPKVLLLSLPWFYLQTFSAENLFRWYTAFSFLLLGIPYLLKDKTYIYLVCCIIGVQFHIMMAIPAILFYIISKAKSSLLSPWVSILIYLFLSLVWSSSFMKNFISPINYVLSFWEHYTEVYGDNLGSWLDGSQHGLVEFSIIRQILDFCKNIFLIFLGYKLIQKTKNKELVFYYNSMLLGIISYPAFAPIELFDRFNQLFLFFQCLIGSYCIIYSIRNFSYRKYALLSLLTIIILGQGFYKRLTPSNKYFTYYIFNAPVDGCLPIEWLIKGF